jgi:dephospho-CoA kinase
VTPPVIGIVGGIGSGKSVVAAEFVKQGGYLIAADELGHEALRQPEIKKQVLARWDGAVLKSDGEIDRRRLGQIVFADARELHALEALVFPFIVKRIREEIAHAQARSGVRFIVLDAAIMLETGWHQVCDKIVFVDTPEDVRLERLQRTRGWDAEEVKRREQAQMPLAEKRRHAHAVVDNSGGRERLAAQIDALLPQEPKSS